MRTYSPDNEPTPVPITLDDVLTFCDSNAVENFAAGQIEDAATLIGLLRKLGTQYNAVLTANNLTEKHRAELRLQATISVLTNTGHTACRSVVEHFKADCRNAIEQREIRHVA